MIYGRRISILFIVSLLSGSCTSDVNRFRRSGCVPTPPPAPGPFQAIVNDAVKDMRAKGDCAVAKTGQQISNDMCVGTVSRNPNFKINLNKPDGREFCQFLDITPLPSLLPKLGPNACREIVECVAKGIKGTGGRDVDIGKDCIEDVFRGAIKDMIKQRSDWTNTLTGTARVSNEIVTSFIEMVGCGQDPSKDASAAVRAIADMFRAMQNHDEEVAENNMLVDLPKIFEMSPEEFYSGIGTRDPGEEGFISFLFGPKISLNWGKKKAKNVNTKYGIFITIKVDEFVKCREDPVNCFSKLDIEEIGLYESYGHGKTNAKLDKASASAQVGYEMLHGTSKKWAGYSFGLTFSISGKVRKVDVSMVFSAMSSAQHNGRQILNELIGFSVYPGYTTKGKPGITYGLGCALAQVTSVDSCSPKPKTGDCPVNDLDGMKKRVDDTNKAIVQEWKNLEKTCRKAWETKWKRCKKSADNTGHAFRGCAPGSRRRCTRFDSNYCRPGYWISSSRRCLGFGRKEAGCRKWNKIKSCTKHGTKKHCHNEKYTSWTRIHYPCGWKNWRVKWCSRNIAKDAFRLVCNTVIDAGNCIRWSVKNGSCRFKRYVVDRTKCVAGWLTTPGRCAVSTLRHCTRWAGSCGKVAAQNLRSMYRDCGRNMMPLVPANY